MEQLVYDLRLAFRNLGQRRGHTLIIVLTLAVGIACTTAMFSVVRGILLRPLPWPDSERLASIWNQPPRAADVLQLSQREVLDLQELVSGLEVGSYTVGDQSVTFEGRTETLATAWVTAELFEILGTEALVGRGFTADEYGRGGPATVILSYELWQRAFGGDAAVLGRTLEVGRVSREIVGVMPPDTPLPLDYVDVERTQVWIGTTLGYAEEWPREVRMFPALARLGPGVTLERARAELDRALDELRRRHPDVYEEGWRMRLTPVAEEVLGRVRPALLALFGAVFFVLMIACANVAHLLLAQADARRNEIAVKSALGASRSRLLRQLMVENLVLALAGGALGTLGAYAAVDALLDLQPGRLPRIDSVTVDLTVLLFGLGASLLTATLFGLFPALRAAGAQPQTALHRGHGTVGSLRGKGSQRVLMVAEVALATVLLAGAGLLVETLRNLARADLGFEPRGLTVVEVSAPRGRYREPSDLVRFWDQVRASADRIPGVGDVSVTMMVPLYAGVLSRAVEVEGGSAGPVEVPRVTIERAAPRIAETMGYRLLRGRDLAEDDRGESPPVALVNETLARYLEEGGVGQRLRIETETWVTVVGVVGDVVHDSVGASAAPRVILPYTQFAASGQRMQPAMSLALRTSGDVELTIDAIREAVREVDADASVLRALDMESHVAGSALAHYRFAAFLLSLFAAVALGLAVVGIYGLLSFVVSRGRREVGIRLALGARGSDIYRLVSRQGLVLALAGLGVGVPAALGLTGLIESLLYGVAPTEPAAFGAAGLVIVTVTVLASARPARRATKVSPIEVLRAE